MYSNSQGQCQSQTLNQVHFVFKDQTFKYCTHILSEVGTEMHQVLTGFTSVNTVKNGRLFTGQRCT